MSNMVTKLARLGVGLESAVLTDQPSPELATPLAEEPQDSLVDLEYQNAAVALENAFGAHTQLSRLVATLESMAQTDGMSDTESALYGHAVDGICAGTPIDITTPSLESATHAVSRLRNVNVALEDVGSRLEAAAKWIKTVLGDIIKAIIKGIIRTISALNSLGNRIDQIEWPKWWDDAEYLWLPSEVFKTFGIAPNDATFETIEKIMQHHADYSAFFETRLVPALVDLTQTAIDDYRSTEPSPGLSKSSFELYDEMVIKGRSQFNDVIKGFFGRLTQGDVPDELDFYHQIRNGLALPGGFRWVLDAHGRPMFEDVIAAHYLERITWTGKPNTVKLKVPEHKAAEDLLSLAKRANRSITKGIDSLDKVLQELERITDGITSTTIGGNPNAIQFRQFMVEFMQAYRGITSVHGRYAQKVTSGLIKFFKAKAEEDQEHA